MGVSLKNWSGDRAIGFMTGVFASLCMANGLASHSPWAFVAALAILTLGVLAPRRPG